MVLRLAGSGAAAMVLAALACLASVALAANRPSTQAALFQPIFVHVGNFGLSLGVSGTPGCPPEIQGCSVPPQPDQMYGSVWFSVITRSGPTVTSSFTPLLRLRLR